MAHVAVYVALYNIDKLILIQCFYIFQYWEVASYRHLLEHLTYLIYVRQIAHDALNFAKFAATDWPRSINLPNLPNDASINSCLTKQRIFKYIYLFKYWYFISN